MGGRLSSMIKNLRLLYPLVKKIICITLVSILVACATNPDNTGTKINQPAQEPVSSQNQTTQLPEKVANAVLEDLSKRTGKPASTLKINQAESRTWNDGCLGLAEPDTLCTQALVPGWLVKATDSSKTWVYHTNRNGSIVKLAT
jgi:hypothetical protein